MEKVFEEVRLIGIVPVLTIHNADDAVPLVNALIEGGLPCVEITFRTEAAKEAMARISKAGLPVLMGAGTVQSVDQVKQATDCGATFIVSAGLNQRVVEYCLKGKIPVMPGAVTPSEFEQALEYGLEVLKFFPAEPSGGAAYLEAIGAPYRKLRFVPTGGIDESNLLSYLNLPGVIACGGSWMVKADLVTGKKFDEVQRITAKAVKTVLGLKLQHLGINSPNEDEAKKRAKFLSDLFQCDMRDTQGSVFVGSEFEVLKSPLYAEHGHFAIGTHSIERAIAYFERKGIRTKPETRSEKDGKLATIYLDFTVGGFAVHLIQR